MKILKCYGGSEWTTDPYAVRMTDEEHERLVGLVKKAREVLAAHPFLDMLRVHTNMESEFLLPLEEPFGLDDSEPEFDVVGEIEGEPMRVAKDDDFEITWRERGLYVTSHAAWYEHHSKFGSEILETDLGV